MSAAGELAARPLTTLGGVGPARAARLARLGLGSVADLLVYPPRALERTGEERTIAEALERPGESAIVRGTVRSARLVRTGRRRSLVSVTVDDGTGELDALFFNQPWRRREFEPDDEVALLGRVSLGARRPVLVQPQRGTDDRPLPPPGSLHPRYPLTEGVGAALLERLVEEALELVDELEEPLSPDVLQRLDLPPLPEAARALHRPPDEAAFVAARRRVAFEHALRLQARIHARRLRRSDLAREIRLTKEEHLEIVGRFPFELTRGQKAALAEVRGDLARRRSMRRLLQGDVGSGKTVVGLYACAAAAARGGQAAFLAPTELLAEQHHQALSALAQGLGLRCALLTGSLGAAERRARLDDLATGRADLVIGTHALLGQGVSFAALDVVVIDEQQRFGVAQRRNLVEKGLDTHTLWMSATPIPRTLALTLYGDVDTSVLRERPAGRGRVVTELLSDADPDEVARRAAAHLERGGVAFWIVPRIEDSDAGPGVETVAARLAAGPLGPHGVAFVHGGLEADERRRRLEALRRGRRRVLAATTVIEVGLDVPDATVCVVEGAERFGLAQLHQLRGRVGRGARDALCLLLADGGRAERLRVLETESDGFRIAEADLRQRGMGDLAGLRQAGESREGAALADLEVELLLAARDLVQREPGLLELYAPDPEEPRP